MIYVGKLKESLGIDFTLMEETNPCINISIPLTILFCERDRIVNKKKITPY
jgi:hypothetical protein